MYRERHTLQLIASHCTFYTHRNDSSGTSDSEIEITEYSGMPLSTMRRSTALLPKAKKNANKAWRSGLHPHTRYLTRYEDLDVFLIAYRSAFSRHEISIRYKCFDLQFR
jgi:hypothetical protein